MIVFHYQQSPKGAAVIAFYAATQPDRRNIEEFQQNPERGRLARFDAAKMAALRAVWLKSLKQITRVSRKAIRPITDKHSEYRLPMFRNPLVPEAHR
jgi:hypothetical protein